MADAPKDRDVIATAAQVDNPSYQDNLKVRRDPDGSMWIVDAQGRKVMSGVPADQKALGATISDGGVRNLPAAGDRAIYQNGLGRTHAYVPIARLAAETIATAITFAALFVLKSRPIKVRLIFANSDSTGTFTVGAAKVACPAAWNASLMPTDGASFVADAGATVINAASLTDDLPTWGFSGWLDVASPVEMSGHPGCWPVLAMCYVNVGKLSRHYDALGAWRESLPPESGLFYATRAVADGSGNYYNTPSTFNGVTFGRSPILGIQALCEDDSVVVLSSGDSVGHGSGGTNDGNGDILQAVQALNLAGERVSLVNLCWPGQASLRYAARAKTAIPLFKPDVIVYRPFTQNDGNPTAATIATQKYRMIDVLDTARANGCYRAVLQSGSPVAASYGWAGAEDDLRKSANAWMASKSNANAVVYNPGLAALGNNASPERFAAGVTTDDNHPNDAGYAAVLPSTVAALKKVTPAL